MIELDPGDLDACDAIARPAEALVHQVIAAVADRSGITAAQIYGPDKSARIARARQIAMLSCHKRGLSSVEIGRAMARDHSTVLSGIRAEKMRRAK